MNEKQAKTNTVLDKINDNYITTIKSFAKQGMHYKIALQIVNKSETWFYEQKLELKSKGVVNTVELSAYYFSEYSKQVQKMHKKLLNPMIESKELSALKLALSYSLEKNLELKEKEYRSKKREPKRGTEFKNDLKDLGF